MSYRILLGSVAALAFLSACKFDVAESTYRLGDSLSLEVERGIAGNPNFTGGPGETQSANPTSCLSAPDTWSVSPPEVTLQSTDPDDVIPELAITPQSTQADTLQTEFPRDGFSWHCYSAFAEDQTLTQDMYGSAKHQIATTPIEQTVRLVTTIGNQTTGFRDSLAFHDVYADALPDSAPRRLAVTQHVDFSVVSQFQYERRYAVFNDRLIVSSSASGDIVIVSRDGDTVQLKAARPELSPAADSHTTVTEARIARPYVSGATGQVSVFTSNDAISWSSADTGLTLADEETPSFLYYDADARRWVLFTVEETGTVSSYFLSNGNADRFAVTGSGPVLTIIAVAQVDNAVVPRLIGVDAEGLKLATFRGGQWQYEKISDTFATIDQANGTMHNDDLFLVVTTSDDSALYRYRPGSGTDMTLVATPESGDAANLVSDGERLLLIENGEVALSTDDGETWTTALDTTKLPLYRELPGASLNATRVEHLSPEEALVSTSLNATGYPGQRITVRLNLTSAEVHIVAGQAGADSGSGPISPNSPYLWAHLGTIEDQNYRFAYNHDGEMEAEALKVQAVERPTTPGSNGPSPPESSSGGGGSLPLVLLATLLLAIRRR